MNLKHKPLFVSVLLDETGSMESIRDDTIRAFNKYLDGLRESASGTEILFSLVTFNSSSTKTPIVAEPVSAVRPITARDYRPNAMTPLIDAAVKLIRATDEAVAARDDSPDVVVAIQTDGLENCSVEYDAGDLALLVKEKEAAGWQFVFLGAGLDAFEAAHRAGIQIQRERVIAYDRGESDAVMSVMAEKTRRFAEVRNPSVIDFTVAERGRVGDRWHGTGADDPDRDGRRSTADDISLTLEAGEGVGPRFS